MLTVSLPCAVLSEVYEASSLTQEDEEEEQERRVSLGPLTNVLEFL